LKTYYQLINQLEHNLTAFENQIQNLHCLSEQSITQCKTVLEQLKSEVDKHQFNNPTEEIEFFKVIKPKVLSYLIFYIKRLHIESKRAIEGNKEQIKYLKKYISRFQSYFNNNLEFYHYYKSHATHLDEQYFLRENKQVRLNIEVYHFFTDDQFSTSHDTTVATIMAYTKLIEYLKNEINKINNTTHQMQTINPIQKESKLQWTGSFVQLVEIAYAFQASGCINNGNASRKEIFQTLQEAFHCSEGDFYGACNDIRGRKTGPTIFLDFLTTMLLRCIQELDKIKNNRN
jgi:hypothetical protein